MVSKNVVKTLQWLAGGLVVLWLASWAMYVASGMNSLKGRDAIAASAPGERDRFILNDGSEVECSFAHFSGSNVTLKGCDVEYGYHCGAGVCRILIETK